MSDLNPGSKEAIDAGCKCPVIDNGRGVGWMGGVKDENGETIFVVSERCDLHSSRIGKLKDKAIEAFENGETTELGGLPGIVSWEYRLVTRKFTDLDPPWFETGICEVYISANGELHLLSDPIEAAADTPEELEQLIEMFRIAMTKPVIEIDANRAVEIAK